MAVGAWKAELRLSSGLQGLVALNTIMFRALALRPPAPADTDSDLCTVARLGSNFGQSSRASLRLLTAFLALWMLAGEVSVEGQSGGWPQFLGPQRNGTYAGPPLARSWPTEGPPVIWKREVGAGFAGPVVSGDRLILFHRVGNRAVVECLEARTGKELWKSAYPTDYRDDFGFDNGPRATPAVAEGRVFTFGAEGALCCWNLADGEPLWKIDTVKEFGTAKGFFGRACSPLVWGDLLIMTLGGQEGAGIGAFDVASGELRWKAADDQASYSSPIVAEFDGEPFVLALTRQMLVSLAPADGRVVFEYPWGPPLGASVTSATPLVVNDLIFVSACYGAGASLLRFSEEGPERVWQGDDVLSNHYATSIHHKGHLYGWHGRQEQGCEFRCVDLKTGRVNWTQSGLKAGTVTLVGDELLLLTERGELLRLPASPEGFKPTARVQVLPFGVRAAPALANGRLYGRSEKRLACFDLTQER